MDKCLTSRLSNAIEKCAKFSFNKVSNILSMVFNIILQYTSDHNA